MNEKTTRRISHSETHPPIALARRRSSWKTGTLCALICVLSIGQSGCIAFYSYYPVRVTVQDAETRAPIEHAEVSVNHLFFLLLNPPRSDSGTTDSNGIVELRAATQPQLWNAGAKGYLQQTQMASGQDNPGASKRDIRLYHEPAPSITVIVPTGFRGLLKIEKRPTNRWIQESIGKRNFTFRAAPDGYVRIDSTPLLLRLDTFPIKAAFEDGQAIPTADYHVTPADIAMRWITGETESDGIDRELYAVGTEHDVQAANPIIYNYINGDPHNVSLNHDAFNALFQQK